MKQKEKLTVKNKQLLLTEHGIMLLTLKTHLCQCLPLMCVTPAVQSLWLDVFHCEQQQIWSKSSNKCSWRSQEVVVAKCLTRSQTNNSLGLDSLLTTTPVNDNHDHENQETTMNSLYPWFSHFHTNVLLPKMLKSAEQQIWECCTGKTMMVGFNRWSHFPM